MSNIFRKQGINTGSGGGSIDASSLANKTDLTAIILTGTKNKSGGTISAGTWFYLNGTPCVAKVDIASGATFTEGTNYEEKTVGSALTELNSKLRTGWHTVAPSKGTYLIESDYDWSQLIYDVNLGANCVAFGTISINTYGITFNDIVGHHEITDAYGNWTSVSTRSATFEIIDGNYGIFIGSPYGIQIKVTKQP